MRFERKHNPETEIVASWFVSVSRSESSGNKVHSLVLEGFSSESDPKYEPEISDASTSNGNDYVIFNAPQSLIIDSKITSIFDRIKITDNVATMIMPLFIKVYGGDLVKLCLSRSTAHRNQIAN